MSDVDNWIEQTYKELDNKIKNQENEFLNLFLSDYLSDFHVDDQNIQNKTVNYIKANELNSKFDEAYEAFIVPFLVWYGKKLLEGGKFAVDYFNSINVKATLDDVKYLAKSIGLNGNKIIKGSFLWNLGQFGEIRQRMQDLIINAIASAQKMNVLVKNIKPLFKSTTQKRSALSNYYLKYAYDPVMHTLNSASYKLAKQYGFTEFLYEGGLIEKSRDFCVERDGNIYTIEQGQEWNNLEWKGKIKGVDFFIQLGGYSCRHHLKFIKKDE